MINISKRLHLVARNTVLGCVKVIVQLQFATENFQFLFALEAGDLIPG